MFRKETMYDVMAKIGKCKPINKMPIKEFLEGRVFTVRQDSNNEKEWVLLNERTLKTLQRYSSVETLQSVKYKRKNTPWTEELVAAFITEVIQNYMDSGCHSIEIAERYNVEAKKLESMASMFLTLHRSRYNLDCYFTDYDYTLWRFREPASFNRIMKTGKITDREIEILEEVGMIAFNSKSGEYEAVNSLLDLYNIWN